MRCILREYIEGKTLWEMGLEDKFQPETVRFVGRSFAGYWNICTAGFRLSFTGISSPRM
jgi:hypothetical protein